MDFANFGIDNSMFVGNRDSSRSGGVPLTKPFVYVSAHYSRVLIDAIGGQIPLLMRRCVSLQHVVHDTHHGSPKRF